MRIPPFWAKGEVEVAQPRAVPCVFSGWGWSFRSEEEARANGLAQAKRIADWFMSDDKDADLERHGYSGYGVPPIREEIKETLEHGGQEIGLITRNAYGALVLNSPSVLFADLDFPTSIEKPPGLLNWFKFAFSPSFRRSCQRTDEQAVWRRVQAWAEANPTRGFRLYRTPGGMRLLMTDRQYEPTAADTVALLETLGSDPLYVRLTKNQECFRARLTPKPFRCGIRPPERHFPFYSPEIETRFRRWEADYDVRSRVYRACELVGEFGSPASDEIIQQTIRLHDQRSCLPDGAPLA
jgi:hypothetical protein